MRGGASGEGSTPKFSQRRQSPTWCTRQLLSQKRHHLANSRAVESELRTGGLEKFWNVSRVSQG